MKPETLPFVNLVSGKYWRFRRAGVNVKLVGNPLTCPEAKARYDELLAMTEAVSKSVTPQAATGTLSYLVDAYLDSQEFAVRKPDTKRDYRLTFEFIKKHLGNEPYLLVSDVMVLDLRDAVARSGRIRKSGKVRDCMSLLYTWAKDRKIYLPKGFENPGMSCKKLNVEPEHHEAWSDVDVDLFCGEGCPDAVRTAVIIAVYTGQRRSDVVSMDWTQYQGEFVRVRQKKTGTLLTIACHPKLREHLDSIKTEFGGRIVRSSRGGGPLLPNGLSQAILKRIRAVPAMPQNRSLHGLRYTAAANMQDAGCTLFQIVSVTGHEAYEMGMQYATQRENSKQALEKLLAHEAKKARDAVA